MFYGFLPWSTVSCSQVVRRIVLREATKKLNVYPQNDPHSTLELRQDLPGEWNIEEWPSRIQERSQASQQNGSTK